MHKSLEICVDSVTGAINAWKGGADRIELCENLCQGGVTPSAGKVRLCKDILDIPVFVLIRPRKGDFLYTGMEFQTTLEDIKATKALGADGIVSGALTDSGQIDMKRTQLMIEAAHPLPFTFHRAFDMCREPLEAIDQLAECGAARILSSGQQPNAMLGMENLRRFAQYAAGRIRIMACGGLLASNVGPLLNISEIQEFHAAVRNEIRSAMTYFGPVNMGDEDVAEEFRWHETDEVLVRALKNTIHSTS